MMPSWRLAGGVAGATCVALEGQAARSGGRLVSRRGRGVDLGQVRRRGQVGSHTANGCPRGACAGERCDGLLAGGVGGQV